MSRGGKNRSGRGPRGPGPSIPNNKRLKREHPYDDLSERVCVTEGCRALIKTRMVLLRDADTCYRCWRAEARARGRRPA